MLYSKIKTKYNTVEFITALQSYTTKSTKAEPIRIYNGLSMLNLKKKE